MIRAALLDIDGTFLDSNDAHAEAWRRALVHFGHEKNFAEIRRCIGMGGDNLLPTLVGIEAKSSEGKKISDYRDRLFRAEFMPSLQPFPGGRPLLQKLKALGIKLVVASSTNKSDLAALLKLAKINDLVPDAITSDDVESSKPDADIIERALEKAHVQPHEAVMIGDTPYDISAANKANVAAIAVTCGGWDRESLDKAAAIYVDPADVLDKISESPILKLRPHV